jgi:hypothetical protein
MVMSSQKIKGMIGIICHTESGNHLAKYAGGRVKICSYGRFLVAMCALLCASQSAQAFFCFSFGFGNNDNDRYRGLPPIAPPARYAPHPATYLRSPYPPPPTPGLRAPGYFYPAFPVPSAMPTPSHSSAGSPWLNQTR